MKSALFALALSPLLAAPAFAQSVSCVMGEQFVPCPAGRTMYTPDGGAMVTGPVGLVGGVVGGALAVPGAVFGTTARAFDPEATGLIAPYGRYRSGGMNTMATEDEDDEF
jgi:hypothetical protein